MTKVGSYIHGTGTSRLTIKTILAVASLIKQAVVHGATKINHVWILLVELDPTSKINIVDLRVVYYNVQNIASWYYTVSPN